MKTVEEIHVMYADCSRDYIREKIKQRATRLARLAALNAPLVIIQGEFQLVGEVITALKMKEN